MDLLLPQAYLLGLIVLLAGAAVVVGRQILRVRKDERALIRLEEKGKTGSSSSAELYELGSVQLRKRLYSQAAANLKLAAKRAEGEPAEAQAVIQNALGFALAAQSNYATAIKHYRSALRSKPNYPVALNNLAYALERQRQPDEAKSLYEKVLQLDGANKTARKRLQSLERKRGVPLAPLGDSEKKPGSPFNTKD
ncbi:tetratricopeptide repeat protein [Cyanobium sp. Morenito 9A2]|uniref:tetratricopeptide repeat protein n=1 Tax=Cyanobium sp. Morenito 9A2 TaxID=2823718 RepID=UPI0020CC6FFC|nr:tetratricopeptide repeat protein [Cyanobium sp. Morenito 9A2]MCP9850267.1 tetratricopeptide repeat protein [Cyanobium sp. Morenito 9A2]